MTDFWLDFWAFMTLIICIAGVYVSIRRVTDFQVSHTELSNRLKFLFATDALVCGITAAFGVMTFISIEADWLLYPMRAVFFAANVYFGWRLLAPIKDD